ncbi:MAG TPA: hypothetical protein VEJ86_12505 [Candidatus Binataceae bacterium]|nr:hypothetical protein [Candidatus Binataceae bacterium]
MALSIRTARGTYRLRAGAPAEHSSDALVLTVALERADGIEKISFRCHVPDEVLDDEELASLNDEDAQLARLIPWIEREFEQIRETALKTIRTERRLHEFSLESL